MSALMSGGIGLMCGSAMAAPLKVFILAGQSNMEGHAQVRTFGYMADDPKTAPILKEITLEDGTPRVCEKVWISSFSGTTKGQADRHGLLTTGFGSTRRGPKIGPEFTFGIYAQKMLDEPILIIKTAWGGKTLNTDFRPPSAGPYIMNEYQKEAYTKKKIDFDTWNANKAKASGRYYRLMLDHVRMVLKDPKRVCPAYNPKEGYELAGFVWFQGWNDMCDGSTYKQPGGFNLYSDLLADFIRDVRKDLSAPEMPFVIGVMGVGGVSKKPNAFRDAMAAPATMEEFKGNVAAVLTENYWDAELGELAARWGKAKSKARQLKRRGLKGAKLTEALDKYKAELYTPEEMTKHARGNSNANYHYLGSAKIMTQIGKGFAEAAVGMIKDAKSNKPGPDDGE